MREKQGIKGGGGGCDAEGRVVGLKEEGTGGEEAEEGERPGRHKEGRSQLGTEALIAELSSTSF